MTHFSGEIMIKHARATCERAAALLSILNHSPDLLNLPADRQYTARITILALAEIIDSIQCVIEPDVPSHNRPATTPLQELQITSCNAAALFVPKEKCRNLRKPLAEHLNKEGQSLYADPTSPVPPANLLLPDLVLERLGPEASHWSAWTNTVAAHASLIMTTLAPVPRQLYTQAYEAIARGLTEPETGL